MLTSAWTLWISVDLNIFEYALGIYGLLQKSARYLHDLNLFPSTPPSTDPGKLRTERISTRVFIISFILALTILLLYTSTVKIVKTITVHTPNLSQYQHLLSQYQQSLTCPCSHISTDYQSFIDVNHSLHHVCSSIYVTDQWIAYLGGISEILSNTDFRITGRQQFQALQSICLLAVDWIKGSLAQFYSNNYVSFLASPPELLRPQSEAIIQQFISYTTNNFALSMRMMRNTTHANALFSSSFSNYRLYLYSVPSYPTVFPTIYDDNCNCAFSSSCISRASIFINNSVSLSWYVPGFYRGCFIIESLRQSRLECLYNQTCLMQLQAHIPTPTSIYLLPLNASVFDHFDSQTAIGLIIDELMVEQWNWTVSFKNYYAACQPVTCSYTLITRNDAIVIITTLFGLVGGLVTALKIVVPIIIICIMKYGLRRRENTVSPN